MPNNNIHYTKHFYVYAGESEAIAGWQPSSSSKAGISRQSPSGTPFNPTKGWHDVYPTGIADGSWYCFEFYVKMDTVIGGVSQEDGIAATWLNGEPMGRNEAWEWSDGDDSGWWEMLIGSNQNEPNGGRVFNVDFDDIVIYTTTPPNLDVNGKPMIGPINWVNPYGDDTWLMKYYKRSGRRSASRITRLISQAAQHKHHWNRLAAQTCNLI